VVKPVGVGFEDSIAVHRQPDGGPLTVARGIPDDFDHMATVAVLAPPRLEAGEAMDSAVAAPLWNLASQVGALPAAAGRRLPIRRCWFYIGDAAHAQRRALSP
jgi:hypothetical protein